MVWQLPQPASEKTFAPGVPLPSVSFDEDELLSPQPAAEKRNTARKSAGRAKRRISRH
jgi:hypothetical protein